MFCSQCGHKNLENGNYCTGCGDNLTPNLAGIGSFSQARQAPSQSEAIDDRPALASFVGEKYDEYYRDKWIDDDGDQPTYKKSYHIYTFNMAGFFLGVFWLCYRKMYGTAFMLAIALSLFDIIMMHTKGVNGYDAFDEILYGLLWLFVTGILGNQLYLKHSMRKIKTMSAGAIPSREQLAKAGGTSLAGAIVVGTLALSTIMLMYLLFAPSWY